MRFKKVFINLELYGQGRGIIMGVTRLLLLGPFYYIQTNFLYFFAHNSKCRMKLTSILVIDYIQTERETETDILLPQNQNTGYRRMSQK